MPPVIHSFLARSMYATRLFNVTITACPGRRCRSTFGSKVRRSRWCRSRRSTPSAGRFQLRRQLYFCINADRDTVHDLEILEVGIAESVIELHDLATTPVG
jgi:hypothetical protein